MIFMGWLKEVYEVYQKYAASQAQKKSYKAAKRAAEQAVYSQLLQTGILSEIALEIGNTKRLLVDHLATDHKSKASIPKTEQPVDLPPPPKLEAVLPEEPFDPLQTYRGRRAG